MNPLNLLEHTNRGFEVIHFADVHGAKCRLQASSIAILKKPGTSAVWLGVCDPNPTISITDAPKHGVKIPVGHAKGTVVFPIPAEVLINSEMHLERNQVTTLITQLQDWTEQGQFATTTDKPATAIHFKDHYQNPSKIEVHGKNLILGLSTTEPKIMASEAAKHGILIKQPIGWVPYPIPPEVDITTTMELTRQQIQALIEHLKSWIENDTFEFNK